MAKKKLADYQAKRDFKKTSEPSGKAKIRAAEYPRFVIQKHAATRLHYDLRLEHDGVFKSWAVTKGPSLNPADKRLAVEVEDHPLDYGDFEGTIPKGEYGGGTVMLWDRGFWMPEGTKDVDAALRKGELKFTLAGEKLQGSFVLVRMKNDRERGKRNNWLLIKHRDEFASEDDVAEQDKSVASGRSMEQIAAGKGRGPKPFMAAGSKASAPGAIWHSNRAKESKAPRAPAKLQAATSARKTSARSQGANRKATGKAGTTVIMGVAISHPDKALWPAEKKEGPVTKRDLAIYLEKVGPWMIEHLEGTAVLHHPRAGRHQRPEVLPAPRHARRFRSGRAHHSRRRSQALPADRSRRRPHRHGADRGGGVPSLELRAAPSSTSRAPRLRPGPRPRRCLLCRDRRRQGNARAGSRGLASSPSARRRAARGCMS